MLCPSAFSRFGPIGDIDRYFTNSISLGRRSMVKVTAEIVGAAIPATPTLTTASIVELRDVGRGRIGILFDRLQILIDLLERRL